MDNNSNSMTAFFAAMIFGRSGIPVGEFFRAETENAVNFRAADSSGDRKERNAA